GTGTHGCLDSQSVFIASTTTEPRSARNLPGLRLLVGTVLIFCPPPRADILRKGGGRQSRKCPTSPSRLGSSTPACRIPGAGPAIIRMEPVLRRVLALVGRRRERPAITRPECGPRPGRPV